MKERTKKQPDRVWQDARSVQMQPVELYTAINININGGEHTALLESYGELLRLQGATVSRNSISGRWKIGETLKAGLEVERTAGGTRCMFAGTLLAII